MRLHRVYDPDSPIISIELLNLSGLAAPDDPVGYRLSPQVYAIDHITTSLPDGDGDGMPDFFEQAHGLNVTLDDSGTDADHDGLSNLDAADQVPEQFGTKSYPAFGRGAGSR